MKKYFLLILLSISCFNNIFCAEQEKKVDNESNPAIYVQDNKQNLLNELQTLILDLLPKNMGIDIRDRQPTISSIKKILSKTKPKFDINDCLPNYYTPLAFAICVSGHPFLASTNQINELVFWMVQNGADVNKAMLIDLRSPLACAIEGNNKEAFRFLLNHGAKVDHSKLYWALLFASKEYQILEYITHLVRSENPGFKNLYFIKQLILRGADYKHRSFGSLPNLELAMQLLKQAIAEIGNEYRNKIKDYINTHAGASIIKDYAKLDDEKIIKNITIIKTFLGEAEEEQQPTEEQKEAAAAAAR